MAAEVHISWTSDTFPFLHFAPFALVEIRSQPIERAKMAVARSDMRVLIADEHP